jgi:hypothetical protein
MIEKQCADGSSEKTIDFPMRPSYYEALGRLASTHPSSRGPFGKSEINKVVIG